MGCVLRLHHSEFFCLVNGKNDSFFFFLFFREKGSSRKRNIGVLKKKGVEGYFSAETWLGI